VNATGRWGKPIPHGICCDAASRAGPQESDGNWWRIMTGTFKGHLESLQIRQSLSGRPTSTAQSPGRWRFLQSLERGMAAGNFRWGRRHAAGSRPALPDLGLLPFVRRVPPGRPAGFDNEAGLGPLQALAERFRGQAKLFLGGRLGRATAAWRFSPFLYHLATALAEWDEARRRQGCNLRSNTRGQEPGAGGIHPRQLGSRELGPANLPSVSTPKCRGGAAASPLKIRPAHGSPKAWSRCRPGR